MFFSIILRTLGLFLILAGSAAAQSLGTCAAAAGTGSQNVTISVTSGQGIVVFYKGISSDPGLLDATNGANKDSQGNIYTVISAVAAASGGSNFCENARYSTASATGSVTLTAPGPGVGLNNFIKACPVTSFATIDTAGGKGYTASTTGQTGSITPTASSELVIGDTYMESDNSNTPTLSGGWTDYVDSGSPSNVSAGSASSATQLTAMAQETSTASTATGLQQSFTNTGPAVTSGNLPSHIGPGMW